ncbi:MAG: hypothetical protein GY926_19805 [bacterium]|nr:hypothetical protein [bacterium]
MRVSGWLALSALLALAGCHGGAAQAGSDCPTAEDVESILVNSSLGRLVSSSDGAVEVAQIDTAVNWLGDGICLRYDFKESTDGQTGLSVNVYESQLASAKSQEINEAKTPDRRTFGPARFIRFSGDEAYIGFDIYQGCLNLDGVWRLFHPVDDTTLTDYLNRMSLAALELSQAVCLDFDG